MRKAALPDSESLLRCGITMICAGTLVSGLGSLMVRPAFQRTGYVAVVVVIAACFAVALSFVPLKNKRAVSHPITIAYLAVSSALVCYMTVEAFQAGSSVIPIAGMLASLLGLYWAAILIVVAFAYRPGNPKTIGLFALAAANSSFSLLLATRPETGVLGSVAPSGCYLILLGVQVYIGAVILHRDGLRQTAVRA